MFNIWEVILLAMLFSNIVINVVTKRDSFWPVVIATIIQTYILYMAGLFRG